MALDIFGNWVPPILDELDPEPPTGGEPLNVVGQPDDSVGNDGQLSIDPTTGDVYVKANGAWTLFSGGGGGSSNLSGSGSPVGVVTPDAVNQFYTDTTGNVLWQSRGLTSADWFQWI